MDKMDEIEIGDFPTNSEFPAPARTSIFSFSSFDLILAPAVRPHRIGIENDMIPNVSGVGYCTVLSWSLFSESHRALA